MNHITFIPPSVPLGIIARTVVTGPLYTGQAADYLVAITGVSAPTTVILPSIATFGGTSTAPRLITVKDEGGAAASQLITVSGAAGTLIDGAVTRVISGAYGFVRLYSNGLVYLST